MERSQYAAGRDQYPLLAARGRSGAVAQPVFHPERAVRQRPVRVCHRIRLADEQFFPPADQYFRILRGRYQDQAEAWRGALRGDDADHVHRDFNQQLHHAEADQMGKQVTAYEKRKSIGQYRHGDRHRLADDPPAGHHHLFSF